MNPRLVYSRAMKFSIVLLHIYIGLVCCANAFAQQVADNPEGVTNAIEMIKNTPMLKGNLFCSKSLVQTVNGLRRLGKEDAIRTLRQYLEDRENSLMPGEREKIHIICRLLFVKPDGWSRPGLGQPYPEVDRKASEKYPFFPIAVSREIPFLLIAGYNRSGPPDNTGGECLRLCEALSLIPKEIPDGGYEEAAQELVKSDDFKTLYLNTNLLIHVEQMIFLQAQDPDTAKRMRPAVKSSIEVEIRDVPQTNN